MPRNTEVVTLYVSIIDFKISNNKIYMLGFQCDYNMVVKCEDQNNVTIKFKV